MIYIRVDGNSEIGMGHVMRCLSIAKAIKSEGEEVKFITASEECISVIKENGFQVVLLDNDYKEMELEVDTLKKEISNVILIDSYQVTDKYITELKKNCKVACIDDIGNSYPADMLINYNIYSPDMDYEFENEKPLLLLGSDFIPVREEFVSNEEFEVREEAKDILITTGGSDPLFISRELVDSFLRNGMLNKKELRYHIVVGPMNQYKEELKKIYSKTTNVILHENVKNMAELMRECDVVVTAAGSTVYEACAVGIPMICFYFVENQRRIAEYFDKKTNVMNCGDFSQNKKIVCFNATDALVRCVIGRNTRNELHEEQIKIVDGLGAKRIAQELIKLGGR